MFFDTREGASSPPKNAAAAWRVAATHKTLFSARSEAVRSKQVEEGLAGGPMPECVAVIRRISLRRLNVDV